jgi:hypothetical protein
VIALRIPDSFFRTLESYKSLDQKTTLMIDAQSDFFRYLRKYAAAVNECRQTLALGTWCRSGA